MDNKYHDIFISILKEAEQGRIEIIKEDSLFYNIHFHTKKQPLETFDDLFPVLEINGNQFFWLWEKYVDSALSFYPKLPYKEEEAIKKCASVVFSNATYEDFKNPEVYFKRRIDFFYNTKEELCIGTDNLPMFLDSRIVIAIRKQNMMCETPYAFTPYLQKEEKGKCVSYELPTLYFGVSQNTGYLYAIQNKKKDSKDIEEIAYQKKIKRLLYHINKGVFEAETEEYKDYKVQGTEYYPENISDVSPSAILSLASFFLYCKEKGISSFHIIPYLPIRYEAKNKANALKIKGQMLEEEKKQYQVKQDALMDNLIQKWMRSFFRLQYHFPNCMITALPWIHSETMDMEVYDFEKVQGDFANELLENWKGEFYAHNKKR